MVRGIALLQLFSPLIQLPKLPLRGVRVQPRHPRQRQRRHPSRHNQLQSLVEPPPIARLAAMLQPQNPQRQNPVDGRLRLFLIHRDHGPRLLSLHQRATRIRRPKALLQVHRGPKCVCLPLRKAPRQHSLQHSQILHPRRLACRRRAAVTVGHKFQSLRLRLPEAMRAQPQHAIAHRRRTHAPDEIALLAPQMQRASAMLGGQSVLRLAACRRAPCRLRAPRHAHARRETLPAPRRSAPSSVRVVARDPRRLLLAA